MRNISFLPRQSFVLVAGSVLLAGCGVQLRSLTKQPISDRTAGGSPIRLALLESLVPTFRSLDSPSFEMAEGIAVDSTGAQIVLGKTGDALFAAHAGAVDFFLRKYNADGSVAWSAQYGGGSNDAPYAIAIGPADSIFVTGDTDGGLPTLGMGGGGHDAFLVKYDANGVRQWATQSGGAAASGGAQVMVNSAGEAYVYGQTDGATDGVAGLGGTDCFLSKFDVSGTRVWTKLYGSAATDGCEAAGKGDDSSFYLTIEAAGNYGALANQGARDVVVVKVDAAGNEIWARAIASPEDEGAYAVSADASGNVYVTGTTAGDLHGHGANPSPGVTADAFVAKISAGGVVRWLSQFGGTGWEFAGGVATDANGYVYVAGFTDGAIDGHANQGSLDNFLARLKPTGEFDSLNFNGGTGVEAGKRLALSPDGSKAYLAGWTNTSDASFFGFTAQGNATYILTYDLTAP